MDKSPTSTINFDRANTAPVQTQKTPNTAAPNRKKPFVAVAFILAVAILLCLVSVIITEITYKIGGGPANPPQGGSGNVNYIYETFSSASVHSGDLILVKEGYEYVFPSADETNIVSVLNNQNSSYVVRDSKQTLELDTINKLNEFMKALDNATGFSDAQLYNGYRSFDTQKNEYEKYTDEVKAGFSEHHTGTCFDINIVGGDELASNEEVWRWVKSNAHKYGFIDRYPDAKKDITGVYHDFTMINKGRPTHFRYVGYPHAYYMNENNLCLEEYLSLLCANYSYEGEHLTFTGDDGISYEVYYVKSEGTQTEVPVPKNYEYTVSGDNMNGFIVTVCLSDGTNG